jgi:hypothetical protein
MPKQPISRDKRIAIVGAGPAGLSTALFLSKNGYHNVTVFEKLGRIGGLCDSITVDGMSFDLGANYVTWAYKETLKIAKEFGATTYQEKPYTSILVSPDGKVTYRDVVKAILHNPFTNKDISIWALIVAAIRYTRLRWKLGPVINPPDALERIDEHPELCVPFKQWLETNRVDDLGTLFEIPITVMGYGQLADIAAPYALRYLPLKTFLPMLLVRIPILGLLFPWPRRFTLGFQRLWERVSWQTNVRLNVSITDIDRHAPNDQIKIKFQVPEQELNELKIVDREMDFDYLILACPLMKDVFARLGLKPNENENRILDTIQISEYCMTTFWIANMDMPAPIGVILPLVKPGLPWAVARQFQDQGNQFTQFYTQSDGAQTDESVIANVRDLIKRMGGKINETQPRWHTFDRFTYFQHVTPEHFANGFYRKLAEGQGQDKTFYVGGLTDFELVEPIVVHSKYLVEHYFAGL